MAAIVETRYVCLMAVKALSDSLQDVLQDLDQVRANLALTPAERLELLRQMDDFFLMAQRAQKLGPAARRDDRTSS